MTDARPRKITYTYQPTDLVRIFAEHLGVPPNHVSVQCNVSELHDAFDRASGMHDVTSIDVVIRE